MAYDIMNGLYKKYNFAIFHQVCNRKGKTDCTLLRFSVITRMCILLKSSWKTRLGQKLNLKNELKQI